MYTIHTSQPDIITTSYSEAAKHFYDQSDFRDFGQVFERGFQK